MIDKRNVDGNSLVDLVAALREAGASIENIDEERHVIYAQMAASDLPTIRLMEGVAYIRVVHQYYADRATGSDRNLSVVAAG